LPSELAGINLNKSILAVHFDGDFPGQAIF